MFRVRKGVLIREVPSFKGLNNVTTTFGEVSLLERHPYFRVKRSSTVYKEAVIVRKRSSVRFG